jgi:hypothetical protein
MRVIRFVMTLVLVSPVMSSISVADLKPPGSEAGKIKIDYFYPRQFGQDQSAEITVVGSEPSSIRSVEISPPTGVSIGQAREVEATDWEKKRGRKRWSIPASVDKGALPGKRAAIVITSEGQSESFDIEVVTHVPVISDLKIIMARSIGASIEFEFSVYDGAGDLGAKPKIVFEKGEESAGPIAVIARVIEVRSKDTSNSIVRAMWGGYNAMNQAYGGGRLTIYVQDKHGHRSNKLSVPFVFR